MFAIEDILFVTGLIKAGIAVAPDVAAFANDARKFVDKLFGTGLISAAEQGRIHAYVDDLEAQVNSGAVPPEYQVRPDPTGGA